MSRDEAAGLRHGWYVIGLLLLAAAFGRATMAHLTLSSQALNVDGGLVTGPYTAGSGNAGGQHRSLLGALLAATLLPLEPIALTLAGRDWGPPLAYVAEVFAGVLVAAYFIAAVSRSRRPTQAAV